ncbi:hypothetical protein [Marilutibacter chinensis]|nr:hypothetical protein [Lysobacter chinensis]
MESTYIEFAFPPPVVRPPHAEAKRTTSLDAALPHRGSICRS